MPSLTDFLKENPDAAKDLEKMVSDQASAAIAKATEPPVHKNTQLMDELKPLKDLQKKLGDNFDLEGYNKIRRELEDKEKQGFVAKGQIDKVIQAHEKEMADLRAKLDAAGHEVQRLVVDGELTRELSSIAVDDGALDYLMYKAKPMIETVDADGKTIARVKNGIKGDGSYKTIRDLVAEFDKDDQFARYVKGSGQKGSGATSSTGGAGHHGNEKLTPTQRIAQGLKKAN